MATEFEAILLAGGRSERMGQDKARLAWRGRPLIEHMLALLREAGARRVHVSGDRPEHAGIPDAWPGRGPVAGIASVLPHCRDGAVVIVPVDLPLLRPARVRGLVDALGTRRAVHFIDHPLPCALAVDDALRQLTAGWVQARPRGPSVRGWLEACGAAALDPADDADLRPANTPADYAALDP